ncbi:acyl-CoA dehydrogenase family protein [Brevibacterium luteolum]|uniref:DNA alkylation response protein n=1 Tax=Brevibacterium luteolum TaxID=199591 RepID=A0A2N6PHA7_9MICO|nr:acyl-CoA dehydrogenase family protein [Brevibacterium luteolum]MBM7529430.1 putative acyl-CoA dehydrogenase [Brevibacterium luteolum]NNG80354.1 DNA alkylation response protein [Brevibacterium luteolum]PMB98053.1 DNA alkylation response protein [Brevibacterium luteolum]
MTTDHRHPAAGGHQTHAVFNQAPQRTDIDEYSSNAALVDSVSAFAPSADTSTLEEIGELIGSSDYQRDAELANIYTPVLHTHDRWGNRIDDVEFHPAYHRVIAASLERSTHSLAWNRADEGAEVERAARSFLFSQIEPGHGCPVSMTHAAVASLQFNSELAEFWIPRATHAGYDPRRIDPAEKNAVTFGMAMTEKQGGSDVRANTTQAVAAQDGTYRLTGHKWFCSAPQSDAFLVLAQLPEGVSCFVVPRVLPGGELNVFRIQRLKNKLGNRSNASSEIEMDETVGWLLGEPGRGVRSIIEMVSRTRFDCVIGSAAGMRQGVAEAAWHTRHRSAFGARLVDQPLMRSVIADLQLEAEAATWSALHLASLYERPQGNSETAEAAALRRLTTAVAKYWVCKRGPEHAYESLECLGGNGYTEDFPLARRYREQPVLAVWEGSGNVIVLDVLRALAREPHAAKAFLAFLETGLGSDGAYDHAYERLARRLTEAQEVLSVDGSREAVARLQASGRVLVEQMALLYQSAVLRAYASSEVAAAFVTARLGRDRGREYGALPEGVAVDLLVERA